MTTIAFLAAQMEKNLLAMQETWVWSLGQEDPLTKGMASHSSILAWRIPWTEEPGGLQFIGSQAATDQLTPSLWASEVVRVVKNPPAYAGDIRDAGCIPGSGRCPGGGQATHSSVSCLANPMDRGVWWATVHGVAKSQTWVSMHTVYMCILIFP